MKATKRERPRKPGTILRELRGTIGMLHALGGWTSADRLGRLADDGYRLLREMRQFLKAVQK